MAAAPAEWDWRSNLDSALELTKARFDEASKRSLELAEDARLRSLELAAVRPCTAPRSDARPINIARTQATSTSSRRAAPV
jgi:hypothetical protein